MRLECEQSPGGTANDDEENEDTTLCGQTPTMPQVIVLPHILDIGLKKDDGSFIVLTIENE